MFELFILLSHFTHLKIFRQNVLTNIYLKERVNFIKCKRRLFISTTNNTVLLKQMC